MTDTIRAFLDADEQKLDELIKNNPVKISVNQVAEFTGMNVTAVRTLVINGAFGAAWLKPGCTTHGTFIPTSQFVRWHLLQRG